MLRTLSIFTAMCICTACATSSERAVELAEHEPDRIEKWGIYEYWCDEAGIMLWHNPVRNYRSCRRRGCIPHRIDWDFYYKSLDNESAIDWRPKLSNNVVCTSRRIF